MKICVLIATHKPYQMPEDDVYLPIEVGRALHGARTQFLGDDTGENISRENRAFCELTALYWAWKNLCDYDYLGLVHYRRHFAHPGLCRSAQRIYTRADFERALRRAPVLLPHRRHYLIETNAAQYAHAHHARDLARLRETIAAQAPGDLAAYDAHMRARSTHICNMFVMRSDLLDDYCRWLFGLLFALAPRLDTARYSAYDQRVCGFLSERLLDVWLTTRGIPYTEASTICLEPQHWSRKIARFLWRKFRSRDFAAVQRDNTE